MSGKSWLRCVAAAIVFSAPLTLSAQRPSSAEAQQMLRTRPELVQQLRQRIASSGLTPDQIRARLRAEGYPADLLDPYLGDGVPGPATGPERTDDVFAAVQALGVADSLDVELLRAQVERTDLSGDVEMSDSLPFDSLGRTRRALRRAPPTAPADSGTGVFGADVFKRTTSQFEPNLAGPVDATYRLGPGDRLVLILTGDVEAAHQLEVTREGFVVIPQVGQVYVANLTLGQLDDVLYGRLGRVYSGVRRGGGTTRFSVSVSRLRSNQVFVIGDVERPGSYRVSSAGTALTALYAAGGPSRTGGLRSIQIKRGGAVVDSLDVYDYLLRGDASHDVRLQSGDVIFVPVHGPRVRILGEVLRPATYEMKPRETLADLIRAAGGFTAAAGRRRVQIERIVAPSARTEPGRDRVVIDIASDELTSGSGPRFALEAGDIVRVFPVSRRVRNRVIVRGNVWAPGPQGFTPGMKLSDAVRLAGGVKPDVYLGQVLVTRLQQDSTRVQLRSAFADTTGKLLNDLPLQEDDEIEIFSVTGFRPERFVAITGAVRKDGRYAYREGMTLRDLVLLAGGLEESAYLSEAEVARLPERRQGGVTASTFRVPLDSSYLFERTPDGRYLGPPGMPAPSGGGPDVRLKPYDNVLILRQPDWELQRTVSIVGEVKFPGRYSLLRKTERLSDLIKRAGGLTAEAYAEGVVFHRPRLGRIGVDLPRVLRDPKFIDNLILQDNDSITVPRFNAVVNVNGAVNSPVAVAYVPGKDIHFYIRAAGGGSKRADLARAYVTQPNGKVESVQNRSLRPNAIPKPRAGSYVYVPEKDPADKKDYTATAAAVAQILASLVAIIVVVSR